ncbi:MAG: YheT family hydrolase, partial [Casimicrobiaceae bacterium]
MSDAYRAPRWLAGAHAQTIYPALRKPHAIGFRRERVDTPDGDFVDFDWMETADCVPDTPTVVLFHGLEGNSASHYARRLIGGLRTIGWRGVIPHFRGCSGEPNRLPRAYHSGDYAEIGWMLSTVRTRVPDAPLYAVGVSLGGSALLNWLGREEREARATLMAAAAVSAPLDLT